MLGNQDWETRIDHGKSCNHGQFYFLLLLQAFLPSCSFHFSSLVPLVCNRHPNTFQFFIKTFIICISTQLNLQTFAERGSKFLQLQLQIVKLVVIAVLADTLC